MGIEISNTGGGGITVETDPLALLKTGGIMSGAIRFDSVGTQNISKGSFDSGRGGYNGISLNCAVGYELNWQAGYLKAINEYGAVQPINIEESSLIIDGNQGASLSVNNYANVTTSIAEGIQVLSTNQNDNQTNIYPAQIELRRYISAEEHGGQTDYIRYLNIDSNGIGQSDPNPDAGTNNFGLTSAGVVGTANSGADTWGLNQNGAGGHNDGSTTNWGISSSDVGGSLGNGSSFGLNTFGVGGNNDEYNASWGFDCNGLGGYNGDNYPSDTSFSLNKSKVSGHIDTYVDQYTEETVPAKDWEFGVDGAKFVDGTIQTSAGITIDPYEGGINFESTNTYGGFRVYQTRDDGDGPYLAIGQLNTFGFNFVSEGNPNGDWNYGQYQDGVHFNDGTIQATAYAPTAGNSGLSQSGNIAHTDYPKEIQLVISGVTYAIPARIIT